MLAVSGVIEPEPETTGTDPVRVAVFVTVWPTLNALDGYWMSKYTVLQPAAAVGAPIFQVTMPLA